ncbi:hypothetical protein EJB05_02628, partial [Eragrostis curvula]
MFFGDGWRTAASGASVRWRAVAASGVALCLLPVTLTLALLWLPLLCCVVAVLRLRQWRARGCCGGRGGGGGRWQAETGDAGDRTRLLHQYLEDQMELVKANAGEKLLVLDQAKQL